MVLLVELDTKLDEVSTLEKPRTRKLCSITSLGNPNRTVAKHLVQIASTEDFNTSFQPPESSTQSAWWLKDSSDHELSPRKDTVTGEGPFYISDDEVWQPVVEPLRKEASSAKTTGDYMDRVESIVISDDDEALPFAMPFKENTSCAKTTCGYMKFMDTIDISNDVVQPFVKPPKENESFVKRTRFMVGSTSEPERDSMAEPMSRKCHPSRGSTDPTRSCNNPSRRSYNSTPSRDFSKTPASFHDIFSSQTNVPLKDKGSGADLEEKKMIVQEALDCFRDQYNKILHQWETNSRMGDELPPRSQLSRKAAMLLKSKDMWVNSQRRIGVVPGIGIGDRFQFRSELSVIGLHIPYQRGIDCIKKDGKLLAVSIVVSTGYHNYMESDNVLIYSGQGRKVKLGCKKFEDQKLTSGNDGLRNSCVANTPVRVIFDWRVSRLAKSFRSCSAQTREKYFYDGLYLVTGWQQVNGDEGNIVFNFKLKRIPGQPEIPKKHFKLDLMSRQPKLPKDFELGRIPRLENISRRRGPKTKYGRFNNLKRGGRYFIRDISYGKEENCIRVCNDQDGERLPSFSYTTNMLYLRSNFSTSSGCTCYGRCSDTKNCACAIKNGGAILFSDTGAILCSSNKSYVYECGPHCNCSSSCKNRFSQNGVRLSLEIFKTKFRGWGVRSRDFIKRGSFICEYVGELLEEKYVKGRKEENEYLFLIGNQCQSNTPSSKSNLHVEANSRRFFIDASRCGNVARFVNHSCSPNLFARRVLSDHNDKRAARVMLFASKDISPGRELTYDYAHEMAAAAQDHDIFNQKRCYCHSDNCRTVIY